MGFQKVLICSILISSIIGGIYGQKPSQQHSQSEESMENFDATVGGVKENPGAKIRFSAKALDAIYEHAIQKVTEMIKSLKLPDAMIPVEGGMLAIKSSKIVDAKIPSYSRELSPPNEIRSHFYGGSIKSEGQWNFRPNSGPRSVNSGSGVFRTSVVNAELNVTSKLGRSNDGHPMVQNQQCKAYLGDFRVEIEGFGNDSKPTVIDQCDNYLCKRILSFFEDNVCNAARRYVSEYVNKKLATFPSKVNLGNQFILDYRVMASDSVAENYIQGDLEGEVLSRSGSGANFHAVELFPLEMNKAISFSLSDYAFNTLFYQAHQQQFPFSAQDLLANNKTLLQSLALNCSSSSAVRNQRELKLSSTSKSTPSTSKSTKTSTTRKTSTRPSSTSRSSTTKRSTTLKSTTSKPTTSKSTFKSTATKSTTSKPASTATSTRRTPSTPKRRRASVTPKHHRAASSYGSNKPKCLGAAFDNATDGHFDMNGLGNLVFKSQRPLQVLVSGNKLSDRSMDKSQNQFSAKGGYIEIYEAGDQSKQPNIILRADVKTLNGQFFPKLNGSNVTGSVEIHELELTQEQQQQQPSAAVRIYRSVLPDETLEKLSEIVKPILAGMFNAFLEKFAQFPVPLVEGYECAKPGFRWSNRTMQIDCDIRVLPNAIRHE